jgi:hypothetical protein
MREGYNHDHTGHPLQTEITCFCVCVCEGNNFTVAVAMAVGRQESMVLIAVFASNFFNLTATSTRFSWVCFPWSGVRLAIEGYS